MPNKKKQTAAKTVPCHYWGKYNVKDTGFRIESAYHLLESLQEKKSDHSVKSKLTVYDSGFKLVKSGAFGKKQKIAYNSVMRFFVFKSEPHLIFFGIEKRKRLFYLVILFRELDQINEICDLIEKKKGVTNKVTPVTEPDIVAHRELAVESHPRIQEPVVELVNNGTQSEPMEEKIVYVQSTEPRTPIVRRNIEYHYDERHTDDMGTTRVDALLLRTNKDKSININQWKEDMQYLDYNPDIGTATISEVGPIYMYTAHFTPSEYNNFGSCESDDSDSWSRDSMSSSDHQGIVTMKDNGKPVVMAHRGSDAGMVW